MGIRITVPADSTANLHGRDGGTITMPVTNSGTVPFTVTADAESITAKAKAHPALTWITAITPHTFRLAPGHTGHVVLTIKVPAGAHSAHYVNIVYRTGAAGNGTVHIAGGVGGTLRITHPGTLAAQAPAQAPTAPAGGPAWLLPIVVLSAMALAAAVIVAGRLLRHRGGHRA